MGGRKGAINYVRVLSRHSPDGENTLFLCKMLAVVKVILSYFKLQYCIYMQSCIISEMPNAYNCTHSLELNKNILFLHGVTGLNVDRLYFARHASLH
jgi:hypothetical protein